MSLAELAVALLAIAGILAWLERAERQDRMKGGGHDDYRP